MVLTANPLQKLQLQLLNSKLVKKSNQYLEGVKISRHHQLLIFFLCFANNSVCSQDDLSNDIESLLEEVRNVQTRLSDLPDESLHAMDEGLRVSPL